MNRIILFTFLVSFLSCYVKAKHWAVVVAGSNGWYNYRHQADVCHAYQVLHKHGIPDENIIVMMYDDIANNQQNTKPGIVINKPGGPDVYKGVVKDYTGENVTPENFIKVLKGDKAAMNGIGSGKVLESGPDDNVFVYFADHGAPNIIAFPTSELHAKDLNDAIKYMHENKMYNKMVFYVEACESGSMFNQHKLASNINVFATTAANGAESSYAVYYDKELRTYLGDVYSVKWLEDSDEANFQTESLQKQFEKVRNETTTSHVQEFGDMSMGSLPIGTFEGNAAVQPTNLTKVSSPFPIHDAVPSPEVPMMILYNSIQDAKSEEEKEHYRMLLQEEVGIRQKVHQVVRNIVQELVLSEHKQKHVLSKTPEAVQHHCYKTTVTEFRMSCFNFNKYEHALRHVYVFANLCDEGLQTRSIVKAIYKACPVAY